MKVDNVKHLISNSTVSPAKPIVQNKSAGNTSNTSNVGKTAAQIMHQHAQISQHQSSNVNINPRSILNMFRPRRLGDRSLSGMQGGHDDVPAMHPDALEEVFGLLNGIKASKSTVNAYTKKLLKRFGQVKNIIDSNYEPEDEEEKIELQNVKRKTTSTVKKEDVKDAIEEMINKDPTNAYIVIENAKRELGLTGANAKDPKKYTQLDKAIIEFSKDNYSAHSVKIRADANIANEASKSGVTQFKELYYALTANPSLIRMIEIHKVCHNHAEFMDMTNLFTHALKYDQSGKRMPTSCPNTIHAAISVMDKRGKIHTMYLRVEVLQKNYSSFVNNLNGEENDKDKTNNLYYGSV